MVNASDPASDLELSQAAPTELDQLKGSFLASLNHEIRTPLSGIMGMTDLLLETELSDEQREYVSAARFCAENLFEILNATLEYSSLEAGQVSLEESEFNLVETLEAAVNQHASKAQAKGLRLFSTLEAGLPETMLGDAARLRQLLGHLIANAIKFTHTGSVELRALVERRGLGGDWLVAEICDTGIGIAPDKLEAIFESFRQLEGGLSRNYPGLGLGLALVRKLAKLMNGEIGALSTLGSGSTFTVRIPLRRIADAAPASPAELRTDSGPAILAVEDNPVGQMVLRHSLQRHRVQVDCVSSGRAALDAAAKRRYDLVLMDLQMPEMNGLETTALMRKLPGYEAVPILALTADSGDELREVCRRQGMQAFLSKPLDTNQLWTVISKHLAAR
jgi:CheY-like chemotaxis protein/nitrogen-specific signal transduction histidine kinase